MPESIEALSRNSPYYHVRRTSKEYYREVRRGSQEESLEMPYFWYS